MENEHVHYDVVNERIKLLMNFIGEKIKSSLPKGWGFNLILFEFDKRDGAVFYISSAAKKDVAEMLRKQADRLEKL